MQAHSHAFRPESGFSLVEMLIALLFTMLLMAGMANIFATSVKTFNTTNETIGVQRTNRWAFEQINDDISQAGFIFPDRPLPSIILNGSEALFRIDPGKTVTGLARLDDANPALTVAEAMTADEFQFFTDMPLTAYGKWGESTPGESPFPDAGQTGKAPGSALVNFTVGSIDDVQAGDVMIILDSGEFGKWEHPLISGTSGGKIVFDTNQANLEKYTSLTVNAGITQPHILGVPVYFIRPAQLVRYSVQAIALDPSSGDVKLPCLVRQQAPYPAAGTVDWTKAATQVVAENVAAFRVDVSFNGGVDWARTGATSWATIQSNANTQLAASGLAGLKSITDPSNVDWFRTIPCLLRFDITTRSGMRREEYNTTAGARDYRTRTQTLLISPRNFGVGK